MSSNVITALENIADISKYIADITLQSDCEYLKSLLINIKNVGANFAETTIPLVKMHHSDLQIVKLSRTMAHIKTNSDDYVFIKTKIDELIKSKTVIPETRTKKLESNLELLASVAEKIESEDLAGLTEKMNVISSSGIREIDENIDICIFNAAYDNLSNFTRLMIFESIVNDW